MVSDPARLTPEDESYIREMVEAHPQAAEMGYYAKLLAELLRLREERDGLLERRDALITCWNSETRRADKAEAALAVEGAVTRVVAEERNEARAALAVAEQERDVARAKQRELVERLQVAQGQTDSEYGEWAEEAAAHIETKEKLAAAEAALAVAEQERDNAIEALAETVSDRELALDKERDRYGDALEQAKDFCARPPGCCFPVEAGSRAADKENQC